MEIIVFLAPYVGVIVSTIMGTEAFKLLFPKANSRIITAVVWGLVIVAVWFLYRWFPFLTTVLLVLAASGAYSMFLEPIVKSFGSSERNRPIGGGGGGPR